jgi:hypothetical protein
MNDKVHLLTSSLALLLAFAVASGFNQTQAASVTLYSVGKIQNFVQTGDSTVGNAPNTPYSFKAVALPQDPNSTVGLLQPPGALFPMDSLDADGSILVFDQDYSSQSQLDSNFPAGAYQLEFIGAAGLDGPVTLNLGAASYPTATPQVANYTAAQSFDPTKDFVLNLNAFAGASAGDFIWLVVDNSSGDTVFQTGLPGQANVLPASAQSATIPANTLSSDGGMAVVSFVHVGSQDATSLPGATGLTFFAKATTLALTAAGVNTGGGSGPVLLSSDPANLARNIATDASVVFKFSKAMAPTESIFWSFANAVTSKFTYAWSTDKQSLTCVYAGGFPANSAITWTLNPTGFTDTSGNPLTFSQNISGMFFTASGSTGGGGGGGGGGNPCQGGSTNSGAGIFSVSKSFSYTQSGTTAPTLDSNTGAIFAASLTSPTNNPVTQVTLTLPNGSTRVLSNFFGSPFITFEQFSTEAALEAAYPAGSYTAHIVRQSGSVTATVMLPATTAYPPMPMVSNMAALQKFDPAADLTVQWPSFTGAAANDSIRFEVHDSLGTSFEAPDPCVPRTLANTATSIVVPKNTFGNGGIEGGTLSFDKITTIDSNSVPNILLFGFVGKSTDLKPQSSGGGQGQAPTLQNFSRSGNGTVQFEVQGDIGENLVVEAKNNLEDLTWQMVTTGAVTAAGILSVSDPLAANQPHRFYRARTP